MVVGRLRDLPPIGMASAGRKSRTVRDAIGGTSTNVLTKDLPNWSEAVEVANGFIEAPGVFLTTDLHVTRNFTDMSLRRFKAIKVGGNRHDLPTELRAPCWLNHHDGSHDVMGRLHWDRPSVTIRTEFWKPEKGRYLHPQADRPITHMEAALLQGFPLDFRWCGTKLSSAGRLAMRYPSSSVGRSLACCSTPSIPPACPSVTDVFSDDDFEDLTTLARQHGLDEALRRWARRNGDEQAEALRVEYVRRADSAQTGYPPKIIALPHGDPWYAGPLDSDRYWPALRQYLQSQSGLPLDQVDHVDEASTKIVAYTHDPTDAAWSTQGLVVGHVQSGKTTNFTAVIAKSVDLGYNLVIVLSGIHNGLRRQTQERLQLQLCRLNSDGWVEQTTLEKDFTALLIRSSRSSRHRRSARRFCASSRRTRRC